MKKTLSLILINWFILCSISTSFAHTNEHLQSIYINQNALFYAHRAYDRLKRTHPNLSPIIAIIDFSLPSSQRRFFVLNIITGQVLYREFVAHGSGSGMGNYATSFSNDSNSHKSSLGVYLTGETYYGHTGYSRHLYGMESGYNSNVYSRAIVLHGAHYVGQSVIDKYGQLGHSWGCFALDYTISTKIIDMIGSNAMIFAFANDTNYLTHSNYLN